MNFGVKIVGRFFDVVCRAVVFGPVVGSVVGSRAPVVSKLAL